MSAGRDGFIPPFMDLATLCKHICCSDRAIEQWVASGQFPPPVKRLGDKKLWRWKDVEDHLAVQPVNGDNPDEVAERIRKVAHEATRRRR